MTADNTMHHPDPTPDPIHDPGPPPALAAQSVTSPRSSRVREAAAWLGWHVLELAGVSVPLALAVLVDGWWAVLAGVIGAGWANHEIQLARRHRPPRETRSKQCGNSETTAEPSGKDRDHHD